MTKKTCSLNLDEKTIYVLDEAAEAMGLSRSQVANMVLSGTLGAESPTDVAQAMFASALESKRKNRGYETEFQPA